MIHNEVFFELFYRFASRCVSLKVLSFGRYLIYAITQADIAALGTMRSLIRIELKCKDYLCHQLLSISTVCIDPLNPTINNGKCYKLSHRERGHAAHVCLIGFRWGVHGRGVHCGPHARGPVPPASRADTLVTFFMKRLQTSRWFRRRRAFRFDRAEGVIGEVESNCPSSSKSSRSLQKLHD